jgi:hypothetical protein
MVSVFTLSVIDPMVMVFNATFNNISVISWWLVLLAEETGVPRENNRPTASHWQILSHHVVSSIPRYEQDSHSSTIVVIGIDSTSSCKSNHNKITQYIMCWSNVGSNKWLWNWYLLLLRYACSIREQEWSNMSTHEQLLQWASYKNQTKSVGLVQSRRQNHHPLIEWSRHDIHVQCSSKIPHLVFNNNDLAMIKLETSSFGIKQQWSRHDKARNFLIWY